MKFIEPLRQRLADAEKRLKELEADAARLAYIVKRENDHVKLASDVAGKQLPHCFIGSKHKPFWDDTFKGAVDQAMKHEALSTIAALELKEGK